MRIYTESELRELYQKSPFTFFELPPGSRLTPAAAQFLSERKIAVRTSSSDQQVYRLLATGKKLDQKPEHLTHLGGTTLVPKNHPRIRFRGKLDSVEALLIEVILTAEEEGYPGLSRDLTLVLEYARQMMRAEVKEEPLSPVVFQGWSHQEIRDRSHHPQRYYGISFFEPKPEHGKMMAKLNVLRTQVRELEVIAQDAFCRSPAQVEREDLLLAVNRMSSLIHVLMLQLAAGCYVSGSGSQG